jgi:hypothetical protein
MSQKKGAMAQFAVIGAAVVVVVIGVLLLTGGGGKKSAPPKPKKSTTGEGAVTRKTRASPRPEAHASRSGRDVERANRREERLKHKQDARGGRTERSSSGGYGRGSSSRGGSSRGSTVDPSQLRAIITDGTGSRYALVGERQYKSGDDIEGHRILEVSSDAVKVEYRQNTYTVKVGQKVY